LFLGLLVAGYSYLYYAGSGRLNAILEELDRNDPDWRYQDLEAKRNRVPDDENSAFVIVEAKSLIPSRWPTWDSGPAPNETPEEAALRETLQESFGELEPPVQLNEEQTKALREEIRRAGPALTKAVALARMPRGRFPTDPSVDPATNLTEQLDTRTVANLLSLDALLRAQDRDLEGALQSCLAGLNLSRALDEDPLLITQLVRIACRSVAVRRLERVLAQGEPPAEELAKLQQAVAVEADAPVFCQAMRGERAYSNETLERMQAGSPVMQARALAGAAAPTPAGPSIPAYIQAALSGSVRGNRAAILRFETDCIEASKLPAGEQRRRLKQLESEAQNLPVLARLLVPACVKVGEACFRCEAEAKCMVAGLAAERYRQATGKWPETLDALAPMYLAKVPLDPFDGKPIRMARFKEGIVIYSVSYDGVDNGGALPPRASPMNPNTDWGIRLWDVSHRRQPPKPLKSSTAAPGEPKAGHAPGGSPDDNGR
jgi:hypothetical protein